MQAIEEVKSKNNEAFWDRRLFGLVGVNWEIVVYLAIFALALGLRFWDLGSRVLHHDESIHALYSWYLYTGRGYVHDPVFHGPFLYHIEALSYFLFGASDYMARFAPAMFGLIMVPMPYLLRKQIGRYGAVVASAMLAISPSILYYSRSLRHDMFAATATVALVVALWRFNDDHKARWLWLAVGSLLVSATSHELTYITVFIFVTFLGLSTLGEWINLVRERQIKALSPAAQYLLVVATIMMPLFTPVIHNLIVARVSMPEPLSQLLLWGLFVVLLAVAAVIGCSWNYRLWLYLAGFFYGGALLLYTSFFSNPLGAQTGFFGSLQYWLSQHGYARGGQPLYYYLLLLPLYEFVPLFFGLAGIVYALRKRTMFDWFLVYWFLSSLALYSWAGEKMPWLVIHIAIPSVFLAGRFIGALIEKTDWREAWRRGIGQFAFLGVLLLTVAVGLVATWGSSKAVASIIDGQRQLLLTLAFCLVMVIVAWFFFKRAAQLGRKLAWPGAALLILAMLIPFWTHVSWQVNFYNGDVSTEMLVYVQSTPDVTKVMQQIEQIGYRTGTGKDLQVAYDNYLFQPFGWYLRDYRNVAFYGTGLPVENAPVVLVGTEDNHDAAVRAKLGNRYVGQRYRLRWWFPEDYKSPEEWIRALGGDAAVTEAGSSGSLGFGDVLRVTLRPESLGKLWNYFMYRQTFNPLGSTDFYMYVRKDLVDGLWASTATTGPQTPQGDVYGNKTCEIAPALSLGTKGSETGQLSVPRNVAAAADGSIYVVDSSNNRIQKFDSAGKFILSWGSFGAGQGQFSEPWGIAVDSKGNVYVADTWNHRIQKFDASGHFIASWGGYYNVNAATSSLLAGGFFGPRGIAVDADDRVYVTDTGNHRVQVFDSNGQFIAEQGTRGSGDGEFAEPVGIALDKQGHIFVADTWNHRVQEFDADFNLVRQWPVVAWEGDSVTNKPFIAVDGNGSVYVTDPDYNRVIRFSAIGDVQVVWGATGSSASALNMPTGLAIDKTGAVYLADSGNNRIVRYEPIN